MDSQMNMRYATDPDDRKSAGGRRREATVRLTTAQAQVRYLQAQYSERDGQRRRVIPAICGINGHGTLALMQAIIQEGHDLPLYQPKNEQAMVHLACGYAKATRRLSTLACFSSIGPGATNMLTGAATATVNRLPVLLMPADTFASRRHGPVLQQLEHPSAGDISANDAFRPFSRFFDRIARSEQLVTAMPEAIRVLLDPAETGAVTIATHQDVLGEAYDYPASFFEPRIWQIVRRPPAATEIDAACRAIAASERPLIIAGGGVRHSAAENALTAFAMRMGIPVAETSAGKGSLTRGPELMGGIGVNGTRAANALAEQADLVICIGTRLTDFTTGSHSLFQHPDVRFVSINVNAADAHKLSALPVHADALEALIALTDAIVTRYHGTSDDYRAEVAERQQKWAQELRADVSPRSEAERMGQGEVIEVLNDAVKPGDWVVAAAGYQPGDLLKLWSVRAGAFAHIEFGYSCMGHEIPAGIGIRLGGATGEVFVVIGDGTYLMNPTELVTAAQENLKITVLVLDNRGYQSINHLALASTGASAGNEFRARDGDRFPCGRPVSVDYVANARSMGVAAVGAETVDELRAALETALHALGTTVIVCQTDPDRPLLGSGAFWDLGVPEVATMPGTAEVAHDHLERRRSRQRRYWR
jgi:3D-(3,5/4)-trihydroxycyclohexane-1,2-dione acylhydrolase (decyclizing)